MTCCSKGSPSYRLRYTSDLKHTAGFRVYFENSHGALISPMHDIPLRASSTTFNMVCEIPRWTNGKFEIATGEDLTPIKQDIKKGEVRFVKNVFPHHGYIWNYGALPQTWEDPTVADEHTGLCGDNDPIDAIEIGQQIAYAGQVKEVKVLGAMALLDEGETDWKIVTIDVKDPMASQLDDIADVHRLMPGLLEATRDWFEIYKVPDGKPLNRFAFNGEVKGRAFAEKIIEETYSAWKRLITAKVPSKCEKYSIATVNQCCDCAGNAYLVTDQQRAKFSALAATLSGEYREEPLKDSNHKSYFVSRAESPK